MKETQERDCSLRNDRSIWLMVASIISCCGLASSAGAATLTENATAPVGNILASQMADLGPGTVDTGRDYNNNQGALGQTFSVSSAGSLSAISVLGRGDSAGGWTTQADPYTGNEQWTIQIGSVDAGTGAITVLSSEFATGFAAGGGLNINDWLTFTLGTPVNLSPGTTYAFSLGTDTGTSWFGVAHSDTDVYAGGYAFNNNSSIDNTGGNSGGVAAGTFGGFAAPIPNNYDFVFIAQSVPEPTTLSLIGLGGLGLMAGYKRRRR